MDSSDRIIRIVETLRRLPPEDRDRVAVLISLMAAATATARAHAEGLIWAATSSVPWSYGACVGRIDEAISYLETQSAHERRADFHASPV